MKTNHTAQQLQDAIDTACKEIHREHYRKVLSNLVIDADAMPSAYAAEAIARLDLIKSALNHLPEPPPPVVDGKTPGAIIHKFQREAKEGGWQESAGAAVLAAFGGQASLEAAIARMESVPWRELDLAWVNAGGGYDTSVNAIRARLISAARGEDKPSSVPSQPAEIPWIEWHGGECPLDDYEVVEWEVRWSDGDIKTYQCEFHRPSRCCQWQKGLGLHFAAYRVLKWREGCGPDAVDWKAKYEDAIKEVDLLKKTPLKQKCQQLERDVDHWCDMHTVANARSEKAEAELAQWKNDHAFQVQQWQEMRDAKVKAEAELANAKEIIAAMQRVKESGLSRFRPISEAGPVPAGAVRVYYDKHWKHWGELRDDKHTHCADILLPEASQPAVESAKEIWDAAKPERFIEPAKTDAATFEAHGKTWVKLIDRNPPCESHKLVNVMCAGDDEYRANILCKANDVTWWDEAILGWRYADEPTPEVVITEHWTPKVGDVVQLKSGGQKMTVIDFHADGRVICNHFNNAGALCSPYFPAATLQPA